MADSCMGCQWRDSVDYDAIDQSILACILLSQAFFPRAL